MTTWIAYVTRRLPGATYPVGDFAEVYEICDPRPSEPVSNSLRHAPPTTNNVALYEGTFRSEQDAVGIVRSWFPEAVITVKDDDGFSHEAA